MWPFFASVFAACADHLLPCTSDASVTYYFDAQTGTVSLFPQGPKDYGTSACSNLAYDDAGTDFDALMALQPEIWANKNTGNTFPPGLLIQDDTGVYVFCDNNDWYSGNWKNQSLEALLKQHPDGIRKRHTHKTFRPELSDPV